MTLRVLISGDLVYKRIRFGTQMANAFSNFVEKKLCKYFYCKDKETKFKNIVK